MTPLADNSIMALLTTGYSVYFTAQEGDPFYLPNFKFFFKIKPKKLIAKPSKQENKIKLHPKRKKPTTAKL